MKQIRARNQQTGVMLLEALIAILIFSVGILAIVGMQATAIQDQGEAKYRTEAAFLANRVVGQMWGAVGKTQGAIQANLAPFTYAGGGAVPSGIQPWVTTVQTMLPGATAFPPTIQVNPDNSVVVTVRWQAARDKTNGAPPHRYQAIAYFNLSV
jgi:type IV pilus assembly protein PilV